MPVGPHPLPWPDDPRLDPELLANGDARNVVDAYRYWTVEAIVADLDTRRSPLHVAIENIEHDLNIGSIVRTANAFNVAGVHVVGRRRWNRRGAMVTDAYLSITHHPDPEDLQDWAKAHDLPILAIDVVPGAIPIDEYEMPRGCVLLFGQEGPGLSPQALAGLRRGAVHQPVRVHPIDQRGGRGGHRHAQLGPDSSGPGRPRGGVTL